MERDDALALCAEVAHAADRRVRLGRDKDYVGESWLMLEETEQHRWIAWVDQVVQGTVKLIPSMSYAASIVLTTAEHVGLPPVKPNGMGKILAAVSRYYGITVKDILDRNRMDEVKLPRRLAMLISYDSKEHTMSAIGRFFDRDHTSVSTAIRRARTEMNGPLGAAYKKIVAELGVDDAS